jgi:hypothetical protein
MFQSNLQVDPIRKPRAILFAVLVILLSLVMGAPALAQDDKPGQETYPTDEEAAAGPDLIEISRVEGPNGTTVTVELPATADTFTSSGQPNTNWATDPNLRVGFNQNFGYGAERVFLAFNGVSSIPSNATVTDARLRLYVNGFSPNGDSGMGILARFLNTAWDPNLITWNNYNPQWGAEIGVGSVPAQIGWRESSNAASAVQQWVSGTRPNFGIMLQGDETPQQRERVFTSLNGGGGLFPRLLVTYTEVVDTVPPTAAMTALPQWSQASFTVRWSGSDNQGGSGLQNFDVQFRINGGSWLDWLLGVTQTEQQYNNALHNQLIEFRVRARDNAGNVSPWSAPTGTRIDLVAPNASMNALPQFTFTTTFQISWSPNEPPENINWYDVQFQVNGGAWQNLLSQTTLGQTNFTGSTGITYGFRARAQDKAGNTQPWSNIAQAQTTVSAGNPTASIVPFNPTVSKQTNFNVAWSGQPVQGSSITSYEVQVSINGGSFQAWNTFQGNTLNGEYNSPGEGFYTFRVRARDNLNRVSEWSNNPLSTKVVDVQSPFIKARVFLPIGLK